MKIGDSFNGVQYLYDLPRENWIRNSRYSMFKCHCGIEYTARASSVKSGDSKSCGCLRYSVNSTHGMKGTRQYYTWSNMKARCNNIESDSYQYYGARGISYDIRWDKFENFWEDMSGSYCDNLELDRIDPNLNYCKENCRWVTSSVQSYNKNTQVDNKSGVTGVFYYKKNEKWVAYISVNNSRKYLGSFLDFDSAVKAREDAEILYFGFKVVKSSRLNPQQ